MLKEFVISLVATLILASPLFAMAKDGCSGDCTSCHSLSLKEASELMRPTGGTVKSIKQSPSKGLFELLMEKDGRQGIIFLDFGKKHLIQGTVFSLSSLEPVAAHMQDLPQPKQVTSVDTSLIPVKHAFVMGNPKAKKKLYVFTDPDCPYCRRMHVELIKLEKIAPDVAINVMLYPLPMHPASYDKSRIILAKQSRELLDKAFNGLELPKPGEQDAKEAVDTIVSFANEHGISGTPTLVMPDGAIVVGMRDAETLKKMLTVQ